MVSAKLTRNCVTGAKSRRTTTGAPAPKSQCQAIFSGGLGGSVPRGTAHRLESKFCHAWPR